VHSVSRTVSSRMPLPRSLFRRIARDASVPASGATAAEFARLLPRASTSSVPLRSVELACGTSPRSTLRSVFLKLKRAAAARRRRRIAVRLAQAADQSARSREFLESSVPPAVEKVPHVPVSRRLQ